VTGGEEAGVVGAGVLMAVFGAILTFAVRVDAPGVDLQVVGLILMVAGGAVIAHARRNTEREHVVTSVETPAEPAAPQHTVHQVVRDIKRD
jgi:hypothetical protein